MLSSLSMRREEILHQAHANLAGKHERPSSSTREFELIHKTRDDALIERSATATSASEQPWQEWVSDFVYVVLAEFAEDASKWLEEVRREQELLRREIAQVREQLDGERGLRDLRTEIEQARSEVPKLPTVVQRLEESQARLLGEVERTNKKLGKVRVNQSMTDYRLAELSKTAKAHAASLEMKIEKTSASFQMNAMHPDAAATLKSFATEALKGTRDDGKLWLFDPNPGTAAGSA
jgi:chromosome segregation ATPase